MSVILLFIDGIGIGRKEASNPFFHHHFPILEEVCGQQQIVDGFKSITSENLVVTSLDACLGIEGLPQSGTGQASLFSGINASALIGKHFGPYPHSGIKHLLAEESLFYKLQQCGGAPHFINAFPPIFFELAEHRNRWSCCTLMTKNAGQTIHSTQEVLQGKAVTAEIKQDIWKSRLSIDLPEISVDEAGKRVVEASKRYDVVLSEYYLTDKSGHAQDMNQCIAVMERYEGFLAAIVNGMSAEDTLVLTSDHGNMEDLSVKTHTYNPVPLLVYGKHAAAFSGCRSLMDVTPAILSTFT